MFLHERIQHWARETPNSAALVFEGQTVSFQEFWEKTQSVICRLASDWGVRAGDRVAYLGINHPDMLYLVFACSHLGAIFTPLNTRLAEGEYRFLLEDSEPRLCLYDDNFSWVPERLANA